MDWSLWTLFAYGDSTWGLLDPVTLLLKDRTFWETLARRMQPPVDAPERDPWPAPSAPAEPAAIDWVALAGGSFTMGAEDIDPPAAPLRAVTPPAFSIACTEITGAQYRACVDAAACDALRKPPDEAAGVAWWMSWERARAFCAWAGGRLCSEAECEHAAGNGAADPYPWGDAAPTCAHAVWTGPGCAPWDPQPACSAPQGTSAHGLCDLAGNLLEWVEDDWNDTFEGAPDDGSAWVDAERGARRVLKGGSFAHPFADGLRAAWRQKANAVDEAAMFGARCCRTP